MNALDILKYGQAQIIGELSKFPTAQRLKPGACGDWSVKDIVSHLVSHELVLAEVLSGFAGEPGPTPHLAAEKADPAKYNDAEVVEHEAMSYEAVLFALSQAHDRVIKLAAQISPEKLHEPGNLPWYGPEYSLDD